MTAAFEARLFGPGLPQNGEPVRVSFQGARLQVGGLRARGTDAGNLKVEAAGFEQNDVLLSWSDAEGDWGVLVEDPAAKNVLGEHAPAILARPLARWRRSVGITRGIWRVAIGATLVLVLSAGLVWWQYDRVLSWVAAQIPLETERRIGQQAVRSAISEKRTVTEGVAYKTLVEIGDKLTHGSRYKYSWYLLDNPQVNAFALPGGYVVVNAGLVNSAKSADELAAVLAHEVQHVEQRHSLQQVLHQLGWATLLSVLIGDPGAITSIVLLQLGNTAFNRELETQADLGGLSAMKSAGVPPQAMVGFFKGLREKGGGMPALFSTHPATDERIKAIEAEIARSPCESCAPLAYDWKSVRESLVADGLLKRSKHRRSGSFLSPAAVHTGIAVPPSEHVAGASQAAWSEAWWQWAGSFDQVDSPVADRTGARCHLKQEGPVWFLAGTYGTRRTSRTCKVPRGKFLFFPLINYVVMPGSQASRCTECCATFTQKARLITDEPSNLVLELDGLRIDDLAGYRQATKECFDLGALAEPKQEMFPAAANGYYVMLRPLNPGTHVLNFGGMLPGMTQAVTYTLIVE